MIHDRVRVQRAQPLTTTFVAWTDSGAGTTPIPPLELDNARLLGSGTADGDGVLTLSLTVPAAAAGRDLT